MLLESGMLPGAMLRNKGLKYRCEFVNVRVEQTDTPFTCGASVGQVLNIPIGHGEGNYYAPPDVVEPQRARSGALETGKGRVEPIGATELPPERPSRRTLARSGKALSDMLER